MVERLEKARLESIHQGNMIYESETGSGDIDIFVAVVKSVNVDENYVTALDMSLGGKERKYFVFMTESELLDLKNGFSEGRFTREDVQRDRERYAETVKAVLEGRL